MDQTCHLSAVRAFPFYFSFQLPFVPVLLCSLINVLRLQDNFYLIILGYNYLKLSYHSNHSRLAGYSFSGSQLKVTSA